MFQSVMFFTSRWEFSSLIPISSPSFIFPIFHPVQLPVTQHNVHLQHLQFYCRSFTDTRSLCACGHKHRGVKCFLSRSLFHNGGSVVSLHPLHLAQDLALVCGQQRAVIGHLLEHGATLELIAGLLEVVPATYRRKRLKPSPAFVELHR